MSYNTFGKLLRLTSWGESHGNAIGGVLDGAPPGIELNETDIQPYLDKRRPGQSAYTTARKESDKIRIESGVFKGLTTGTPIAFIIANEDVRSKDYDDIAALYRPAHADYSYDLKYGMRDYRGGGRASARETAIRVAGGAIARKILTVQMNSDFIVRGALVEMGGDPIHNACWQDAEIDNNEFFSPDSAAAERWRKELLAVRKAGDSLGAVIEVRATGVSGGLGAPLYGKLDADLAAAMMSIPAVKGVEIGAGFAAAKFKGSENADEMRAENDGSVKFLSNHAGGILGGISSGTDIIVRFAVKPTSSILQARRTISRSKHNADIVTKGRHDPCVGIRAVPIGEAMTALVLADHWLMHRGQCG